MPQNEVQLDMDELLERYDQTDPKLQREIVAMFAARSTLYVAALAKIASVEVRPQDAAAWPGRGLVGCRDTARVALETRIRLKSAPRPAGESITDRIVRRVAELPDRSSPHDWPEAMMVTAEELTAIIQEEMSGGSGVPASDPPKSPALPQRLPPNNRPRGYA